MLTSNYNLIYSNNVKILSNAQLVVQSSKLFGQRSEGIANVFPNSFTEAVNWYSFITQISYH